MADLITQPYLTAALADFVMTTTQAANLPAVAAAASRLVRDYCGRQFTRATYDELYSADPRTPILLREWPVNGVLRVGINPTTVLTVANADTATNQRAYAGLATTGSVDAGQVVTGLTLARLASGVTTTATLAFSASITLGALATAVAGLGAGWTAAVASGYAPWPTADLRSVQGNLPALAPGSAALKVHADDAPFTLEERIGRLTLGDYAGDPFASPRWGPMLSTEFDEQRLLPVPNNVRAIYDAGFDVIPESLQDATVEVAKQMLVRWQTDQSLKSESDGTYRWEGRDLIGSLPPSAMQTLALFRSSRA